MQRCIHTEARSSAVREKLVEAAEASDSCILVDGYNQLATIYAILKGEPVYKCSDGLTRDLLLAGTKHVTKHSKTLATHLAAALRELKPREVIMIFDSQPSHSAKTAKEITTTLNSHNIRATHIVAQKADKTIISSSTTREECIIATSDIVIAERTRKLIDLASLTATTLGLTRAITNIAHLLAREHTEWCLRSRGPVA